MGGCTNCKGKAGCDHRKGEMLASVDAALEALYPTRTWGEPDDTQSGGMTREELAGLADELAQELGAATFVREGGDDEPCDYIYVLSMGRTPCVVQVRDHGVPAPTEWRDVDAIEELYLRVVISQRARVAAVQQVGVDLVASDGGWLVRERPRAGVYDAPLLHRMQKLVAILPAYDLLHVDFGEIAHAPPGYAAGTWRELFGGEPSIANYLFYPQPTTMVATSFVERA
jgi:ABC-type amino acid transport substrate-binding protein